MTTFVLFVRKSQPLLSLTLLFILLLSERAMCQTQTSLMLWGSTKSVLFEKERKIGLNSTLIESDPLFKTEIIDGNGGSIYSLNSFIRINSTPFALYQMGDIMNYFEGSVLCKSSLGFTGANSKISITYQCPSFKFEYMTATPNSFIYPLEIKPDGVTVTNLLDCNTFQMHNGADSGKVMISDKFGYGKWADPPAMSDDDWLTITKTDGTEPPPPVGKSSLYLNPKYQSVLIGTDMVPTGYIFAVNGKAICEELVVLLNTDWPDYVFSKDYSLPPLQQVESFIIKNKHLPGVPDAQEVLKNGINVGEANALLLKKVEELTLYIIALQKEVDQLKNANRSK